MKTNNTNTIRPLALIAGTIALGAAACGGPRIDRTGWECWEEVACAEGYFCGATHLCEQELIADIPGVDSIALGHFNDGVRAMNDAPKDYQGALSAFQAAVSQDPDFWEALENLGLVQMDLGLYTDAAATFRTEAEVIDDLVGRDWPVEPRMEIYLNIGKALALAGDTTGAADAFGQMLQLDPENAEARANLAALNLQTGSPDAARLFIQELLVLSQNDVGALSVLANIAKDTGDMQLAEYLWEKCLQEIDSATAMLEVDCEPYLTGNGDVESPEMAWCAQYQDMDADSRTLRESYNRRRGDRMLKMLSDIQNELGIVAWGDDNDDAAERFFRQAVTNNPSNSAARVNLGTVYLEYASWGRACGEFSEALALRPRERAALIGHAACAHGDGDLEMAMERYELAFDAYSTDQFITRKLAEIASRGLGDIELGLSWYDRLLGIQGTNATTCDPTSSPDCKARQTYQTVLDQQRQMQDQQND
ncbi:MAG: tetratricopeptide (TPR) repeat protein [Bradymonadia bacterium]|jgi:tetratricopeptide (TPR) repeat protein